MGRLRLAAQGLTGPGLGTVGDAVRWMTAMQAQDLQSALWAVGQRVPGARLGDVRGALDRGEIVRSWPMRGTLHLLAPEDLKWILAITSERLIRAMAGRHRELGISAADAETAREAALRLVSGGGSATRAELFRAFEAAGQSTAGQRGIHLLGILCQRAWLVQGPPDGNQQRVVAFDEWIKESRPLGREEGIAELLLRYLRSHGPATERDFSWWAGIPLTEVRAALAGLKAGLAELEFEGTRYWLAPETAALLDDGVPGARSVLRCRALTSSCWGTPTARWCCPPSTRTRWCPAATGCSSGPSWQPARWSAPGRWHAAAQAPASWLSRLTRLTGCGLQSKSRLGCRPRSTGNSLGWTGPRASRWRS